MVAITGPSLGNGGDPWPGLGFSRNVAMAHVETSARIECGTIKRAINQTLNRSEFTIGCNAATLQRLQRLQRCNGVGMADRKPRTRDATAATAATGPGATHTLCIALIHRCRLPNRAVNDARFGGPEPLERRCASLIARFSQWSM